MTQIDLLPPRSVPSRAEAAAARYHPWLEVSARVRVHVAEWSHAATLWVRWAVPCPGGTPSLDGAVPFDAGRRAAVAGAPPAERQAPPSEVDRECAERAVAELLRRWRPEVHRSVTLAVVSEVGEPRDAFRRRCLAAFGGAVRGGAVPREEGATALAAVQASIESRRVDPDEVELLAARVGVGWYAEGERPSAGSDELLLGGPTRAGR